MEEKVSNLLEGQRFNTGEKSLLGRILPILLIIIIIGLGVFTGYYFSGKKGSSSLPGGTGVVSQEKITKGNEFGSKDVSKFKDTATGVIEANGVDGEGTHKLVREGGPSQTACLTSSVLDLDQFVGKKVQVWGESFQARKCGWLMDIGKIKILE